MSSPLRCGGLSRKDGTEKMARYKSLPSKRRLGIEMGGLEGKNRRGVRWGIEISQSRRGIR